MIKEKNLNKEFFSVLKNLITNDEHAIKLSNSIKLLEKPNATKDIVNHIDKLLSNV